MKKALAYIKNEDGNSVVEATFVVTMAIVIVFIIMMWGFVYYQTGLIQATADKAASDAARTYPYIKKDPATGFIGKDSLPDQGFEESIYWFTTADDDASQKQIKEMTEGKAYIKKIFDKRRLLACTSCEYDCKIRRSQTVLFQDEITVTIKEEYYIPLMKFVAPSSNAGRITVKRSGKALCYDPTAANSYYKVIEVVAKNWAANDPISKAFKSIITIAGNTTDIAKNIILKIFDGDDT